MTRLFGVAVVALAAAATGAFGASSSGTITTIAGIGTRGYGGDDGRASSARLSFPQGVAVDDNGNVYITDTNNHRVRKVSTGGRITTIAGTGKAGYSGDGGPARTAKLNSPQGVAVDAERNVYIADHLNQRVRKVSPSGIITTFAGTGDPTSSGDGGPASSASVFYPMWVAVDGRGSVYITGPNDVRKVSDGTITTIVQGTQKLFPEGVAVDRKGNVYLADWNNAVRKVTPGGKLTTFAGGGTSGLGDGGPATSAKLGRVFGVAVDKQGTVYISDPDHNRVRRVGPGGTITTVAGTGVPGSSGDGGRATSAWLAFPMGLAVDGKGNLYIADRDDNRVRKVWKGSVPAGALPKPSASAGGVTRGSFKTPSGNIVCAFSPEFVGCGIKSGLEPPPPPKRPGCSRTDRVFLAATGRAQTGASYCPGEDEGDAGPFAGEPVAQVLAYGTTWSVGGLRCTSASTGLTCRNKRGHGFFLSRERWRAF